MLKNQEHERVDWMTLGKWLKARTKKDIFMNQLLSIEWLLRTYLKIYVCEIFVKDKYFLFTVEYLLLKFLWKFFEM